MYAVRNIKLCTKDCLCLYICPTGATDTEKGQIDREKCLSDCRLCVDACPSHAISLVPDNYPKQQTKKEDVIKSLRVLSQSKTMQETIAQNIKDSTDESILKQFAQAIKMSNRIMAEDILREAGFMLPQSEEASKLVKDLLLNSESEDFPKDAAEEIIRKIGGTKTYRCTVCGHIHKGELPDDFICPVCTVAAEAFELI